MSQKNLAVLSAVVASAVTGCSGTRHSVNPSSRALTIYSSLPQRGPERLQAVDVIDAEQLALQQINDQVGAFKIRLISLDDASLTTGTSSQQSVTANAQRAASDPTAVAYIGELTPGSSRYAAHVLRSAGLLQVTPGDTASVTTGAGSGQPETPTFARFVPSDGSEAGAQLALMKTLKVKRLLVFTDASQYGRGIARSVTQQAASSGIRPIQAKARLTTTYRALARAITASRAGAAFIGGLTSQALIDLWNRIAAVDPEMKLFGPSGLDNDAFAAALELTAQQQAFLSEPGVTEADLPPAGQAFFANFKAAFGRPPGNAAFFGYAAVQAVLDAIHLAGRNGPSRQQVARRFFTLRNVPSVLGNYTLTSDGQTTIAPEFRISRITNGRRSFYSLITAPRPNPVQANAQPPPRHKIGTRSPQQ